MTNLFTDTGNLLPYDGDVRYFPAVFSPEASEKLLQQLIAATPWRHEAIRIFGREVLQPRLTAWYGDAGKAYSYSGITMQPLPWTDTLAELKQKAEALAGQGFNSALLNLYRDGQDSMGWHRDNEPELGPNPVITSLSFGAVRSFKLKHHRDKKKVYTIDLEPGSILLMQGLTQHHWLHALPKTALPKTARINITFRSLL
ncbi:alpha-ketoglutarate-dependent dioxygenase AlkB family protein [Taibaiella chishuiensis]|uniref:DNA-N1-methyladenine dioxygenase n=1 Tax=Taibaiella chishuiensis TaxID=1434707 RepID=A0A2P8D5M1_9BACT|nr:alpha-ketoglutarate-dependent dioxygenase AlkB [Taibaiella chishuiensis]PSK92507.1 DNA-N1-methyladenine dioxygenase [Taibaiella chishuiensis]